MEVKIDGILNKLEMLVRLEMRYEAAAAQLGRMEARLDKQEIELDKVADEVAGNTFIAGGVERFSWLIVSTKERSRSCGITCAYL